MGSWADDVPEDEPQVKLPVQPPTHYCVFDVNGKALCVPKPVPWQAVKLAFRAPRYMGIKGGESWPKTWAQGLDRGWKLCGLVPGTVVDHDDTCEHHVGVAGAGVCDDCSRAA